jgi:hypothetical protein
MDAAAIVFFLCATASMCVLTQGRPGVAGPLVFAASGLLLATSKTQHVPTSLLLAVTALWLGFRARRRASGLVLFAAAAGILACMPLMLSLPKDYAADPLFSSIFLKLAPESPDPARSLEEVGLSAEDTRWIGTYAFDPPSPMMDPAGRLAFSTRMSYRPVLAYYFHHPARLLRRLYSDLKYDSNPVQPYYANYRKIDGVPPKTLSRYFHAWSSMKNWLLRHAPYHVLIVYAGLLCGFWRKPLLPVALFLFAAGGTEFTFATLADGMDTNRHLILFHLITDVGVVFLAGGILASGQRWIPSPET